MDESVEAWFARAILVHEDALVRYLRRCWEHADDIHDLEQLLAKMQRSAANTSDWITVHRQFHERLCAVSDAPRLMHQISALHSVIEPLMRIWMEARPSVDYVQDVHREILAALKAGDAEGVEALVRAHILRTIAGITAPRPAAA